MPSTPSRRDALRVGATAVLAGLSGCIGRSSRAPAGQESTAGPWPQFGSDPANTGHAPDGSGPRTDEVAWQFDTGSPTANCSPVLVDGVVYTGSSGDPGTVYTLDAASGEERWSFDPAGWVTTAPAVVDGTVYLATWGRRAYALDATDGTVEWETDLGHRVSSSSPTVVDGTVYVGTFGDGPLVANSETDESEFEACAVVALDAATGDERWRYDEFDRKEKITATPAVVDGTVYAGSDGGDAFALDATTGEERWRRSVGRFVHAGPAVVDGTVYVGVHAGGSVRALDAATGEREWSAPLTGGNLKASPAVADGTVYALATRLVGCAGECDDDAPESAGFLHALDAATGEERWRHRTAPDTRSAPAVADGTVYFGRGSGVEAVAADSGEAEWSRSLGGGDEPPYVYSSPAVGGGRLFVSTSDGVLYAVGGE